MLAIQVVIYMLSTSTGLHEIPFRQLQCIIVCITSKPQSHCGKKKKKDLKTQNVII